MTYAVGWHEVEVDIAALWRSGKRWLRWFSPWSRRPPLRVSDQWDDWAHRLPSSAFIIWLAGHVADELIAEKPYGTSLDDLLAAVKGEGTGLTQRAAERFLERYFFSYPAFYTPQCQRMIALFRRLVRRKIRRRMMIHDR